jgi:hypothetical protein
MCLAGPVLDIGCTVVGVTGDQPDHCSLSGQRVSDRKADAPASPVISARLPCRPRSIGRAPSSSIMRCQADCHAQLVAIPRTPAFPVAAASADPAGWPQDAFQATRLVIHV